VECSPAPGWNGCGITAARIDSNAADLGYDPLDLDLGVVGVEGLSVVRAFD
jgi:hypothetical protein